IKRLTSLLLTGCMVVPAMSLANDPLPKSQTRLHTHMQLQTTVSGVVRDVAGSPMAGVTVHLKRTGLTTTTDEAGRYQLTVGTESDTLVFSFVGYLSQEIAIDGQTTQDVVME